MMLTVAELSNCIATITRSNIIGYILRDEFGSMSHLDTFVDDKVIDKGFSSTRIISCIFGLEYTD